MGVNQRQISATGGYLWSLWLTLSRIVDGICRGSLTVIAWGRTRIAETPPGNPTNGYPQGKRGRAATIPPRIDQPANRRMTALCLAGKARNSGLAISICRKVAGMLRRVANLLHRPLIC